MRWNHGNITRLCYLFAPSLICQKLLNSQRMQLRIVISVFILFSFSSVKAQDLPFADISEVPNEYNSGTLMARTIAGLGFRYYWATEDLRQEDLDFKPIEGARSTMENIVHIYELSSFLLGAFDMPS